MEGFRDFKIVDLSVCLDEGYPLTWPSMPLMQKRTINWYKRVEGSHGQVLIPSIGAFYSQALSLDEHTGTHLDFPSHNIPSSDSGLPNAGPSGDKRGDEYPLENLCGPAAAVDLRSLLDQAPAGRSPAITPEMLEGWEKVHGQINAGDVVLLNSCLARDTGVTVRDRSGERCPARWFARRSVRWRGTAAHVPVAHHSSDASVPVRHRDVPAGSVERPYRAERA